MLTEEDRAYAAITDALLMWMVMSSLVLLGDRRHVPAQADHADPRTGPCGAGASAWAAMSAISSRAVPREVREAAQAFLNMKQRIERHVEQRTAMLAGVSHDLRTILTRFRLELAFLGDGPAR